MQKVQRGMNHWRNKIGKPEFNHKDFKVEHVDVTIQGLDPSFNDYCIANISDIHLGQWITPKHLDGVIDILNKENPDSITTVSYTHLGKYSDDSRIVATAVRSAANFLLHVFNRLYRSTSI